MKVDLDKLLRDAVELRYIGAARIEAMDLADAIARDGLSGHILAGIPW